MIDRDKKKKRRTYSKPQLRSVDLVADQVLSVGCKTTSSGIAFGVIPCTANSCGSAGS